MYSIVCQCPQGSWLWFHPYICQKITFRCSTSDFNYVSGTVHQFLYILIPQNSSLWVVSKFLFSLISFFPLPLHSHAITSHLIALMASYVMTFMFGLSPSFQSILKQLIQYIFLKHHIHISFLCSKTYSNIPYFFTYQSESVSRSLMSNSLQPHG